MTDFRDIEDEIPMTAITMDVTKIKDELIEEDSNLEVRYEIYDQAEEENTYNCEACDISFVSIEDHIRECHADEDVIVKVQGEDEDEDNEGDVDLEESEADKFSLMLGDETESMDDEDFYETEYLDLEDDENAADFIKSEDVELNPIATETNNGTTFMDECVDKDGRLYNRKMVKINVFWDDKEESPETTATSNIKIEPAEVTSPLKKAKTPVPRTKSVPSYKCDQCELSFCTARAYSAHLKLHTIDTDNTIDVERKDNKFECDICHTVFGSNKSMRLHSRMHNPIKPRLIDESYIAEGSNDMREYFHCEICNKSYEKQFEVIHMRMHSDEPSYHCTICNKVFNSLINLEMHVNAHQEAKLPPPAIDGGLDLPYKCSFCGRQFSRPHEKVKHERIHTGEKPHICEICGKSFRVSYCLTLHMRTHTGARPYACPFCNKRFKAQSVYNHHLMTHSDSRPYQCPFCPKAFKTSVQLAGHKNSHTKPFSCSECNRPFATLYAVRGHMETHKKPNHNLKHKCRICGATYARSFALRDHIREQHSDDIITISHIHENTDQKILPDSELFSLDVNDEPVSDADGIVIDEFETEEVVTDWILPKK